MTRTGLATTVALAGCLTAYNYSALGAGFAIVEQSVPSLGTAVAGAAVSAEDASTIWFNPAGMTRVKGTQTIAAVHIIQPNIKFSERGSTTTTAAGTNRTQGGDGSDAGNTAAIPNFYYKQDLLGDKLQFGLGINVPFGQDTDYDDGWVGRYHAIQSRLHTVNINPAFAARVWKGLSLGAGVSALYGDAKLTNKVDVGALIGQSGTLDLLVEINDADDWTYTGNVGAMYEFTDRTRVGAHYRSCSDLDLKGDAKFVFAPDTPSFLVDSLKASGFVKTTAEAKVKLPDTVELSGYHAFRNGLAVMASSTWYNWDRLDTVDIKFRSGLPDSELEFDYNDVWRHSIGATYSNNNRFIWRLGFAYDESPVDNRRTRSARLPDNDRYWATAGFSWLPSPNLKLDFAYAHLFIPDTDIDTTVTRLASTHVLKGRYNSDVDIVSAQLTYNFK